MKRLIGIIVFLVVASLFTRQAFAASQTAYQDYVFQFDQYRQLFNNFRVALGEYQQFGSLEAQQEALDKAKLALGQRDIVARTYLLFLNEKVTENPGILATELNLYRTLIVNEVAYFDGQSTLAQSLSSTDDAEKASQEFAKHYPVSLAAMRQIVVGIQLGYLNYFATQFESSAKQAQALITAVRPQVPPAKQAALDRWLLEISNKRNLYQQKSVAVRNAAFKLVGDDLEQTRKFNQIQTDINTARQYLVEGVSFLNELANALKYE